MGLRFCSFASGSTGNCYLVRTENTALLVDCGISGKRILGGLSSFGMDALDLSGILITHEHTDHIQSIRMMAKKADNANVYVTRGTLDGISDKLNDERATIIGQDDSFSVGDIDVKSFGLSHDAAEPVGYTFTHEGRTLAILTDTGTVTEEIYRSVRSSNAFILEANHEVNILRAGPYPYELQQRILSDRGHLSNEYAGEFICRILDDSEVTYEEDDLPYFLLAHISRNNNTPAQAMLTVRNVLLDDDHFVDRDIKMSTASYCDIGPEIEV